jgi:lipopolysaccharide heptosyltransferase II
VKLTVSRLAVIAPNWLGDAVMALPAIADIRRASPTASLAVIARPAVAPIFSLVPGIDEVVALASKRGREMVPDGGGDASARPRFDAVVVLPNSFHSALMAWRAGIPERWGYRTDWRRPLLTRAIDPPGAVHQVEYYQRLVAALGFANGQDLPGEPHVVVSEALRAAASAELRVAGWDGARPLVALAPGAAYGGAKRWPPTYFAELALALGEDGIQSVMVGSRADLPVAREIESALGARSRAVAVLNLMGTDLPMLAGTLAMCRAIVSNDSGAMHLGAAIGVRVTAVFGSTDERLTRPAGAGHAVLTNPVWCRPCMMRECPIDHRCMRGVGVDRVVGAVRQML